ncbi:MAG: XRE family transcriptional regulator [Robiginitomaculum sp.]|nr:XRE family transcriptional regulator [Robiginitomaculum sp.]
MSDKDMTISASKGSVFDDLGLAPEHRIKADMALMIKDRMKTLKLNQTKAAIRMGIKQPDLSNILRGHFRGYSVERLTRLLTALDCDVDIVIRPHGKNTKPHVIHMNSVLG